MNKYRTHTCGQLNKSNDGQEIKLSGWVNSRRDHGGLIFLDLRDRYGITQVVIDPENLESAQMPVGHKSHKSAFDLANEVRDEYVVSISGKVRLRPSEMINKKIKS